MSDIENVEAATAQMAAAAERFKAAVDRLKASTERLTQAIEAWRAWYEKRNEAKS